MAPDTGFLADLMARPWAPDTRHRLQPAGLFLGYGAHAIEIAVAQCGTVPTRTALLETWKHRRPYLWLLYSAEALAADGSLRQILAESHRFAGSLAERLRERIYDEVVPVLAQGIAAERNLKAPGPTELEQTYEMALTVLFRLLFIAYADP